MHMPPPEVLVFVGEGVADGVCEGTITAAGFTADGAHPVNRIHAIRKSQNTERIVNITTSFRTNIYFDSDMIRGRQF